MVEDFATVEGVMERFEQWKEEDGASYNDAYVSLCLPKVIFVFHNLILRRHLKTRGQMLFSQMTENILQLLLSYEK